MAGLAQVRSLLWHIIKRLPERSYLTVPLVTLQSKAQKPEKNNPPPKKKTKNLQARPKAQQTHRHVRIAPFLPMLHARKFFPMSIVLGL